MKTHPFERYWAAVMDNPRREKELPSAYVVRIAELVAGEALTVKSMPEARLPYRDSE